VAGPALGTQADTSLSTARRRASAARRPGHRYWHASLTGRLRLSHRVPLAAGQCRRPGAAAAGRVPGQCQWPGSPASPSPDSESPESLPVPVPDRATGSDSDTGSALPLPLALLHWQQVLAVLHMYDDEATAAGDFPTASH